MHKLLFIFALCSSCLSDAGGGKGPYADGQSQSASFLFPSGVTADAYGNVFVADKANCMIRKINSTGYVSTVAGNGANGYSDGQSINASFNSPYGVAVDLFGNLFVTDNWNHMIRKINATGYVSTLAGNGSSSFADGQGMDAEFNSPTGLAADLFGNIIVADYDNNIIRRINSTGYVVTIAGSGSNSFSDGQDVEASFSNPQGLAINSIGDIFVCDSMNSRIRKINSTGYVDTLAGSGVNLFSDGQGISASFKIPSGLTIDSSGNLFVSDSGNHRIRKINSYGYVTTIAGAGNIGNTDGEGSIAAFNHPQGITIDGNGTIFVADYLNNKIRKIYFISTASFSTQTNSIFTTFGPSASLAPAATVSMALQSISPSIPLISPNQISPILKMYLKPEFTYSALIGMIFVGVIFTFIVKRKMKTKISGRREKFLQNLEMQRKLELKQRQQSLPRNLKSVRIS